MLRLVVFCAMISMICSCTLKGKSSVGDSAKMNVESFEGVYEFISETTTLTKPEKLAEQRTSDQWVGMWFFHANHYSYEVMNKRRPPFPKNMQELGYQSAAGAYEPKGNLIILRPAVSLSPIGLLQSKTLEYKIEGDTLTLIETITPYMENLSEGQRTTVLHRVH